LTPSTTERELFESLAAHDPARVRGALSRGADPNAVQEQYPYFTALHAAIDALDDGAPFEPACNAAVQSSISES
jgi:hypothetical protein